MSVLFDTDSGSSEENCTDRAEEVKPTDTVADIKDLVTRALSELWKGRKRGGKKRYRIVRRNLQSINFACCAIPRLVQKHTFICNLKSLKLVVYVQSMELDLGKSLKSAEMALPLGGFMVSLLMILDGSMFMMSRHLVSHPR